MHRPGSAEEATAVDLSEPQRHGRIRRAYLTNVRLDPFGAVLAATIIGGSIRLSTLDIQSFWDDEGFTVALVRLGFVDMLKAVPETEASPPLYYVLAWGWAQIFGAGEWGLRSLSALIGTATIPIVYIAARTIGSRRGAAVAAFLVAASPLLVWIRRRRGHMRSSYSSVRSHSLRSRERCEARHEASYGGPPQRASP